MLFYHIVMIAEAPISDAKAKSEARRAKILAREAARISASKNEGPKVGYYLSFSVSSYYLLHRS